MNTITRPTCPAQHTDQYNNWCCSGHHAGPTHLAVDDAGVVVRMWIDPDLPDTDDLDGPIIDALEPLIVHWEGLPGGTDRLSTPIQALIAAYRASYGRAGVAS